MSKKDELKEKSLELLENIRQLIVALEEQENGKIKNAGAIRLLRKLADTTANEIRHLNNMPEWNVGNEETQMSYSRFERMLSSRKQEYLKIQRTLPSLASKPTDQALLRKQAQYARMMSELAPISIIPSSDPEIEKIQDKVRMHQTGFYSLVKELNAKMNAPGSTEIKAYDMAIKALEAYKDQLEAFKEEIREREQELEAIERQQQYEENDYQEAEQNKNQKVFQVKNFMSNPTFLAVKANSKDTSLKQAIDLLNNKLAEIEAKDYRKEYSSLGEGTRICEEDTRALQTMFTSLRQKVKVVQAKEEQLKKHHTERFLQQKETFEHVYEGLKEQLKIAPQLLEPLISIKNAFEQITRGGVVSSANIDQLMALNNQLQEQGKMQVAEASKQLQIHVAKAKEEFAKQHQKIKGDLEQGNFIFNKEENNLIQPVHSMELPDTTLSPTETLWAQWGDIQQKEAHLKKVEDILERHQRAKEWLKKPHITLKDLQNLVHVPENHALLNLIARYDESNRYIKSLSDHIDCFSKEGIEAIRVFIEDKKGADVEALSKKIVFCQVLYAKNIVPKTYLKEAFVISAVDYLHQAKLDHHITEDLLKQKSFCIALNYLSLNQIKLTEVKIRHLIQSPARCKLIGQLNEFGSSKPSRDLIEYALNLKEEAVNALLNVPKEYRNLDVIALVGESPELQQFLQDNKKENCWPFLQNMFERFISLKSRLDSFFQPGEGLGKEVYKDFLMERRDFFARLNNALTNPDCKIGASAEAMKAFNSFCKENSNAETRSINPTFLQKITPILLSAQPAAAKAQDIEAEINRNYKGKGILGALKEFASLVFEALKTTYELISKKQAPKGLHQNTFFSEANLKLKSVQFKKALQEQDPSKETSETPTSIKPR